MFANFIFAARHWIYYLHICIFAAGCCIVWHTMFHCLPIYIFVTDSGQFQYFTFLPHDIEFCMNLHFCRYAGCCIDCAFTLQFQYFFVYLHFCRWLLHWLCIYIFAVYLYVLITNLHFLPHTVVFFARSDFATCCCSCIVCAFTFLPFVLYCLQIYIFVTCCCIVYKFTFLPLAVALFTYLHFAACFFIAYVFFLFCKFCFKVY